MGAFPFLPGTNMAALLGQAGRGAMPSRSPLIRQEFAFRNAYAPQVIQQGRNPFQDPALMQGFGAMLGQPPAAQMPGMRDLSKKDIWGTGLAMALSRGMPPARSLGEAFGNIGSALMSAPGLALAAKQEDYVSREKARQEAAEKARERHRQAAKDEQDAAKFAQLMEEWGQKQRDREKTEKQEEVGRLNRERHVQALKTEWEPHLQGDPKRRETAFAQLQAYLDSGNEDALEGAYSTFQQTQGAVASTIPGSGGQIKQVQMPDGRTIAFNVSPRADLSSDPVIKEGLPGGMVAVSVGGQTKFYRPDDEPGTETDLPESVIARWEREIPGVAAVRTADFGQAMFDAGDLEQYRNNGIFDVAAWAASPEGQQQYQRFYDKEIGERFARRRRNERLLREAADEESGKIQGRAIPGPVGLEDMLKHAALPVERKTEMRELYQTFIGLGMSPELALEEIRKRLTNRLSIAQPLAVPAPTAGTPGL